MNLEEYGILKTNFDLYDYNMYKVHSICKSFIIVDSIIKLTNLIKLLDESNIKHFIIGGGSNIILPSKYEGIVIKLDFNDLIISKNNIEVGSSYQFNKLALETIDHNLKGLEWACGVPGTVGGAIVGNAGAYGDEIMNHVDKLEILENNKVKMIRNSDLDYSYRYTSLKTRPAIVLKAYLTLTKGNKEELMKLVRETTEKRAVSQILDYPSAGSVFRNPENNYAGKLIEDLNLKGYSIGGAKVSEKHANFIINYNNATGEDIINLIDYIHDRVLEAYNIDLILEQQIIN